jgi:hypothetical protein
MNIKFIIGFVPLTLSIASCNNKHKSFQDYLKNSDSASIAFYQEGDSSVHILIKDKTSLNKLGEYIDGDAIEPLKSKETGSIWFYEGGKNKMQVDFILTNEVSAFSYMMNDKIYSKTMSEEAEEYMSSVKKIAAETL